MSGWSWGWEARVDLPRMASATETVLLLGGNIGDPMATLNTAETLLKQRVGDVLARSRDHWTEPWGFLDDRLFLNRALLLGTALVPEVLLKAVLAIELELGRERAPGPGYSSRTLDIDILFFDGQVIRSTELEIPHPRVHERRFALAPAADIVPDLIHPTLGRSVLSLLNDLRDPM